MLPERKHSPVLLEKVRVLKEMRDAEFDADFRARYSEFRNGCDLKFAQTFHIYARL